MRQVQILERLHLYETADRSFELEPQAVARVDRVRRSFGRDDELDMAIIEFVDRDTDAKGQDSGPVMSDGEFEDA